MIAQEIFNKVWTAMIAQGQRSFSPPGSASACAYRGEHGLKCAVGHLIPDDLAKRWDGYQPSGIMAVPFSEIPEELQPHLNLLRALQRAHDNAYVHRFVLDFKERAAAVAEDFGLTIPE